MPPLLIWLLRSLRITNIADFPYVIFHLSFFITSLSLVDCSVVGVCILNSVPIKMKNEKWKMTYGKSILPLVILNAGKVRGQRGHLPFLTASIVSRVL
jgi:hypothetical protein